MASREQELDDFKTLINLCEFAAAEGFKIDRRTSSRNSVAMRHPGGDKIVIGLGVDRHWTYFSVHDLSDHGSIIDFVQKRRRINLGEVRKLLRPWIDGADTTALPRPDASATLPRLEPVPCDLLQVRARLDAMRPFADHHAYLVDERRIPPALLSSDRFHGRVLIDARNNAVFPHWNIDGLCGYEVKNSGFSGFAPGGVKGLWGSRKKEGDTTLVIAESAIDAISFASLHGMLDTRLVSTAGQLNRDQPALLRSAIDQMPPGSQLIAAVDHDAGGDSLAEHINGVYEALRRSDIVFTRFSPPTAGDDWNDALRASLAERTPSPGPS